MGGTGFLGFLLEARSMRELSLRTIVLERQAASDETLLLKLRRTNTQLVRARARLKRERAAHTRSLADLKRRGAGLGSSFSRISSVWTQLQRDADSPDPAVAGRAKTALALIGSLPTRTFGKDVRVRGRTVAMQRCPAAGPHAFSNDWGACRGYRCSRRHRGNDVFAPKGSPAVAVAPGRVERFGTGGNAGLAIYLMSDDGVEYRYFHMTRFASVVGAHYDAGDIIGYVGNTGNARGRAPHIHFEVHPGGGVAINPYPSLVRVC
jgi:murein DD-endopeptidase MepM/ murein hydrolase activator NlpD